MSAKPLQGLGPLSHDDLILDGRQADANITGAITGAVPLTRTMEGASSTSMTLLDPDRKLLRSGFFDQAVDLGIDGLDFRNVRVGKQSGGRLLLTFEDLEVALMRSHRRPKSAVRKYPGGGEVTRAEFQLSLVRAVKARRIPVVIPDLRKTQPIAKAAKPAAASKESRASKDARRAKGIADNAKITVKDAAATGRQRRVLDEALDEADELGAATGVMIALVCALIQESRAGEDVGQTGNDDVGVLQQGRNWISEAGAKQAGPATRAFLVTGPTSWKKVHGSLRTVPGGVESAVKKVQISVGGYQQWRGEAARIVDAYGGGEGSYSGREPDEDDDAAGSRKAFEFSTTGTDGKPVDYWTASGALAEPVARRRWMSAGTFFYVAEEALFRARPRMVLSDDSPGVREILFDYHRNKVVGEVTVECFADRWAAPPGSVVQLEDQGPASKDGGRWLVSTITKPDIFKPPATVTLRKPMPSKAEPDAEMSSGTGRATAMRSAGGGSARSGGTVRDRIIAEAEKTLTSRTGFSRYSMAGALTTDPTPPAPARTDCSQWARAVYLKAGAGDPGTYTGAMIARGKRTSDPKPGDLLLGPNHVEIFVGGDKTYGHGSPPIDVGSVAYHKARGLQFYTFDFLD